MSKKHKCSKRMNAKGRSTTNGHHVRHYPWQMGCEAWKALPPVAKCLEMELKALYFGHNNGSLFLSVREAAYRLGVSPNTALKAFRQLEEKGFIKAKEKGGFSCKVNHATTWILTEFGVGDALPTKDFMRWRPKEIPDSKN